MSLSTASILKDGTLSAAAGTATSFISKGDSELRHKLVLDDGLAFALATVFNFSIQEPRVNASAPNGQTQMRNNVSILTPILLANGNYTTNSLKLEWAFDVETTTAQKDTLFGLGGQILFDTDYAAYREQQAMS